AVQRLRRDRVGTVHARQPGAVASPGAGEEVRALRVARLRAADQERDLVEDRLEGRDRHLLPPRAPVEVPPPLVVPVAVVALVRVLHALAAVAVHEMAWLAMLVVHHPPAAAARVVGYAPAVAPGHSRSFLKLEASSVNSSSAPSSVSTCWTWPTSLPPSCSAQP